MAICAHTVMFWHAGLAGVMAGGKMTVQAVESHALFRSRSGHQFCVTHNALCFV